MNDELTYSNLSWKWENETPFSGSESQGWNQDGISIESVSPGVYHVNIPADMDIQENNFVCEYTLTDEGGDYADGATIHVGLAASEGIVYAYSDWDEDTQQDCIPENPEYVDNTLNMNPNGATIGLFYRYKKSEDATEWSYKSLSESEISFTDEAGESTKEVGFRQSFSNNGVSYLEASNVGTYYMNYVDGEGVLHKRKIVVDYPIMGFYKNEEVSMTNYLKEFDWTEENATCYLLFQDETQMDGATLSWKFNDGEVAKVAEGSFSNDAISISKLKSGKGYAVELKSNAPAQGWLQVEYSKGEVMESSGINMQKCGVLISDSVFVDGDCYGFQNKSDLQSSYTASFGTQVVGIVNYSVEQDGTPFYSNLDDYTITLYEGNAQASTDKISYEKVSSLGDGTFLRLQSKEVGEYKLVISSDSETFTIPITVDYPTVGFYSSEQLSKDDYISSEFSYDASKSTDREFYMITNGLEADETVTLLAGESRIDASNYLKMEKISNTVTKLTILPETKESFELLARRMCGEEQRGEAWLNIDNTDTTRTGRVSYEDGEDYTGYAGCYITKREFDLGDINWDYGGPLYWVHASTVQGVIEKLKKEAGKEITIDDGGTQDVGDDQVISFADTGYVRINASWRSNGSMPAAEYVMAQGALKGISINSGNDVYATQKSETDETFNFDQVYELDSSYEGLFTGEYFCKDIDEKDQRIYGCQWDGSKQAFVRKNAIELSDEEIDDLLSHKIPCYMEVFEFPNLHIDSTVSMNITGCFTNGITLGFAPDSTNTVNLMNCSGTYGSYTRTFSAKDIGSKDAFLDIQYKDATRREEGLAHGNMTVSVVEMKTSVTASGDMGTGADIEKKGLREALGLSQKELEDTADGTELKVAMEVNKATDVKWSEDNVKNTIMKVDVKATVGEQTQQNISKSSSPISITVPIPSNMIEEGVEYFVKPISDDGTTNSEDIARANTTDISSVVKDNKITFSISDFTSYYAICSKKKAVLPAEDPTDKDKPTDTIQTIVTGNDYNATLTIPNPIAVQEPVKLAPASQTGTILDEANVEYMLQSDGTCIVTNMGKSKTKKATIPGKITVSGKTYKVFAVGKKAFAGNKYIKEVSISSAIDVIQDGAFQNCVNLKKVKIGKNVDRIEAKAFAGCINLTSVTLPTKLEQLGKFAFRGDKKMKKIVANCPKLKKVSSNVFEGVSGKCVIKTNNEKAFKKVKLTLKTKK